ncbi:MAG: hypothetical protein IJR51_10280 [Clostridia bacterium]|nr:hypothetical protein [Clostridia bacterium]
MKDPMLMQLFAEEAAPQDGAKTEAPAAPEKDAEPAETPAPEAPPEGKQAAPSAEEPGGKRNETPAQKDVENNAGLLAGVAAAMEAKRLNGSLKKIVAEWEESAEALRSIYPGFDLRKEARENGEFARLLQAGVSVRRAYEAANLEAILAEAMRYAVRTAGKKTADSMRSQYGRVQENSVLDRAPSLNKKDVESLTKADILKILDDVSRGAKIKF